VARMDGRSMNAPQLSRAIEIGIAVITTDDEGIYSATCICGYALRNIEVGTDAMDAADRFDALVKRVGEKHMHVEEVD